MFSVLAPGANPAKHCTRERFLARFTPVLFSTDLPKALGKKAGGRRKTQVAVHRLSPKPRTARHIHQRSNPLVNISHTPNQRWLFELLPVTFRRKGWPGVTF